MFRHFKFLVLMLISISFGYAQKPSSNVLIKRLLKLTIDSKWNKIAAVPLKFNAHHTQGIVKIGDYFYMSAVEVIQKTKLYDIPQNGMDRDAGIGKGHIYKFDKDGNLLADISVGSGDVYHPGGIDYDGTYIWIPVTEYRPKSFSVIYKLKP